MPSRRQRRVARAGSACAERNCAAGPGSALRPARLDQHAARVPAASLGDAPVLGRSRSGLPHARVQPEIADQLLGSGKALDIPDRGDQCEGDNHINAGDGHQPLHPFIGKCRLGETAFDRFEIVGAADAVAGPAKSDDCHSLVVTVSCPNCGLGALREPR